jgi:transcriptional regulator with XRE-family HTH domain
MLLGNKIRSLRDEQGILQRQVAAYLEIDTPMFSKIERGDRRAKRSQVTKLAEYFHLEDKELTIPCGWQIESWMQSRAKMNYSFMLLKS